MAYNCLERGAVSPDDDTCQSIFESFLVLDYTDPGYGQVHFLTEMQPLIQV